MKIEIVANKDHLSVVDRFLQGRLSRVRIYALNVHDVQLINTSLRLRLIRLLGSECTVTIAFGENLSKPGTGEPRNEFCRRLIGFLKELEEHGARVWYVPRPMLHAKVLYVEQAVTDSRQSTRALITSANFTNTAIRGDNFELGVAFENLESHPTLKEGIKRFTDGVLGAKRSPWWEGV